MTTGKISASSVTQDQDLLIFGGDQKNDAPSTSIEKVSISSQSSKVIGQMPFHFAFGCVLKYGQNDIIAIGGQQNGSISSATWTSSLKNLNNWSPGPNLKQTRELMGCGVLPELKLAIVTGGKGRFNLGNQDRLSSTELIRLDEKMDEKKVKKGKIGHCHEALMDQKTRFPISV